MGGRARPGFSRDFCDFFNLNGLTNVARGVRLVSPLGELSTGKRDGISLFVELDRP